MPLHEPKQEALPDFSTHPDYKPVFDALVAGGQNREHATSLLADLWRKRANNDAPQPPVARRPLEDQLGDQQRGHPHGQAQHLLPPGALPAPQNAPRLAIDDQGWLAPDKAVERAPRLPPIDSEAKSLTMSLDRPTTYAIERFRKFEYTCPCGTSRNRAAKQPKINSLTAPARTR
jgi:hypothetical protein